MYLHGCVSLLVPMRIVFQIALTGRKIPPVQGFPT